MVIMSLQAISNLVHDWHKDPESHDPADEFREQIPGRADAADPTGSLAATPPAGTRGPDATPRAPGA